MSDMPLLFDGSLHRQRLRRAAAGSPVTFLLDRMAEDLDDRLVPLLRNFNRILDLGTPTPAFADVLARRYPQAEITRLVGTPQAANGHSVVGDLDLLPFADERFDLIVSGLALHVVNDLPGLLIQARRALSPDGLLMVCLPGGMTLTQLRQSLTTAEAELTGGASPRVAPFVDVRDMGSLLQRAGLALPVTDVEHLTVRYPQMFALMADLRGMAATNVLHARLRRPTPRRVFLRAAALYAQQFGEADGRIPATFDLIWASGWAPHDSQQRPLRPGSAKARLADALNTIELRAGEKASG
jgi:SAM-dependent methyltransferase